jgi:hypothetical protein
VDVEIHPSVFRVRSLSYGDKDPYSVDLRLNHGHVVASKRFLDDSFDHFVLQSYELPPPFEVVERRPVGGRGERTHRKHLLCF